MDYLTIAKANELAEFSETFNYRTDFMGQQLFPLMKTEDLFATFSEVSEGWDVPVMGRVSAFDAEAPISDRPTVKAAQYQLEKLFIKEKLNQSERLRYYLNTFGASQMERNIKSYIYNDWSNLIAKNVTRWEVMTMEFLCTGKNTIKENNLDFEVNYGFPSSHRINVGGWSDATHDIPSDFTAIQKLADKKIVRAITSSKILEYLMQNDSLYNTWKVMTFSDAQLAASTEGFRNVFTEEAVKSLLLRLYGIEFVITDDYYRTSYDPNAEDIRFFDNDTITFLTTRGTLGNGLLGVTPEEMTLRATTRGARVFTSRMMATVSQWVTEDPVAVWSKASSLFLPAPRDMKQLYICKVGA